jgi:hypothetical protein
MSRLLKIICFLPLITFGQSLKVDFIVRAEPDNLWTLHLQKDSSYTYTHWSGFADDSEILDSGTYRVDKEEIIFTSILKKNDRFAGKTFYLKKFTVRRNHKIDDCCVSFGKNCLDKRFLL